jgi:hypothetical protein
MANTTRSASIDRAVRSVFEQLEDRRLLSVSLDAEALLTVIGTSGNDRITVSLDRQRPARLNVDFNGKTTSFAAAKVGEIRVEGRAGDDHITIDDTFHPLEIDAVLLGGRGNDRLTGAGGDDTLEGSWGNDLLQGREGNDRLDGGAGNDRLMGGVGYDAIWGGDGDDRITTGKNGRWDLAYGGDGDDDIDTGNASEAKPQRNGDVKKNTNIHYGYNSTIVGYTPKQINRAYGLNLLTNSNSTKLYPVFKGGNLGENQTIAIVTAFHAPTIQEDLDKFSAAFGLPTITVNVVAASGNTPDVDRMWSLEATLDVQRAHAIAPYADIILVEADTNLVADMYAAVDVATDALNELGGGVMNLSWGVDEEVLDQLDLEAHFARPESRKISYIVAAADSASIVGYPEASPSVTAVGGTSLDLDRYGFRLSDETAWSDSGGGYSIIFSRPVFQEGLRIGSNLSEDRRAIPDVSFLADPETGVAIFSTTPDEFRNTGWAEVGGNSAAAPQFAGIVTLANQFREAFAKEKLGEDLNTQLYQLARVRHDNLFYDIVKGSNGHPARDGFDLATGWGSPRADKLIEALAGFVTGDIVFRNNFVREMDNTIQDRGIINFSGVGTFKFTSTHVTLGLATLADNGGEQNIYFKYPLRRVGKTGFGGYGRAEVALDDGTTQLFPLRFSGNIYRDKFGRPHVRGTFFAINTKTLKPLTQGTQPILYGYFKP